MSTKAALIHCLLLIPVALAFPSSSKPTSSDEDSGNSTVSSGDSGSGPSSIDFSHWELQLPVGQPNKPDTVPGSELATYHDPKKQYYYNEGGVVIMKVPGAPATTGCVHTPNSKHCRTEFVERNPSSWDPKAATNRLSATVAIIKAGDSKTGTCFGQIHIDDSVSSKPVAELYINAQGDITFGVEQTRAGGNEKLTKVTNIPLGTKFTYMIAYEKNELSVTINGGKKQVFSTYSLDAPKSYFKAGNYNQGDGESEVHFWGITLEH